MIFTLFAILSGLWAYDRYKRSGQINYAYVALALILLVVDGYFLLLQREIAQFYWASGTSGSGLTYAQCTEYDEYGNCQGYIYHTYLSGYDQAVGTYIGYKKFEEAALPVLMPALGIAVLASLCMAAIDMMQDAGILRRLR